MKALKRSLALSVLSIFILGGVNAFALSGVVVDYFNGTGYTTAGSYSVDPFTVTGGDVNVSNTITSSKLSNPAISFSVVRRNWSGLPVTEGSCTFYGTSLSSNTFSNITNDNDYRLYISSVYTDQLDFYGTVTD